MIEKLTLYDKRLWHVFVPKIWSGSVYAWEVWWEWFLKNELNKLFCHVHKITFFQECSYVWKQNAVGTARGVRMPQTVPSSRTEPNICTCCLRKRGDANNATGQEFLQIFNTQGLDQWKWMKEVGAFETALPERWFYLFTWTSLCTPLLAGMEPFAGKGIFSITQPWNDAMEHTYSLAHAGVQGCLCCIARGTRHDSRGEEDPRGGTV